MNTPDPILKLARVAAITLSLGMLVWFVYRSSGSHNYRSAGSRSTNLATSTEGIATNAPALGVSTRSVAPSSKSLDGLITSTQSSPEMVEINGRAFRRQAGADAQTNAPVLAPSSKSLSQPIFSTREVAEKPIVMPGSKSAPFSLVESPPATVTPAPSASPTPADAGKNSGGRMVAPSSKLGLVFKLDDVPVEGSASTPSATPTPVPVAPASGPAGAAANAFVAPSSKRGVIFLATPAPATPAPTP